jgi:hypothetical protein
MMNKKIYNEQNTELGEICNIETQLLYVLISKCMYVSNITQKHMQNILLVKMYIPEIRGTFLKLIISVI